MARDSMMATETAVDLSDEGMNERLRDHRQRSLAVRRLRRHKLAVVGAAILVVMVLSASMGGGQATVIFALGMIYVPVFARLVRGSTLSLREEVFVMAAESYGAGAPTILLRHILPNMVGIIVVQATIGFSSAIVSEATLSFLGLGVPPPLPSWGRDLNDARGCLRDAWWLVMVPAMTIVINVLGINFLGDGLRDALDPRMRTRG